MKRQCEVPECDETERMAGKVCSKHYQRMRTHGSYYIVNRSPDVHKLTNHDKKRLLADCAVCGPSVPVSKIKNRDAFVCKESGRDSRMQKKYGITRKEYDEQLRAQNFCCLICPKELKGTQGHIDHDHQCCPYGRACRRCIRGILCENCNRGIGMFQDNVELLSQAITYLQTSARPFRD